MEILYLSIEEAEHIHRRTVHYSGGGSLGKINLGALESVLCSIQNDTYYPRIEEKITHLFFCTCKYHCFVDGNKRLAITLSTSFLLKNGYLAITEKFIHEMENISYHVAAGRISKELLLKIMIALLDGTYDFDESLKLEIFQAIRS